MSKTINLVIVTLIMLCMSKTVLAEISFPLITSIEGNYIGIGVGTYPDYSGSDDSDFGVAPTFRYEFGHHRNVELIGNYLSANLMDHNNWHFGPALLYRFGRDDDVDDDVVARMSEIDDTLEAGFFVSYRMILDNNPRNRFIVSSDALFDVGGEHNGYSVTANVRYWRQVSTAIDIGVQASLKYVDGKYNETYYGVNSADSAATGLDIFEADSGINSARLIVMGIYHLSQQWHVGAGLRWERLTGDASDSPIVDVRGDDNQFIGGIGVVYSWGGKLNFQ